MQVTGGVVGVGHSTQFKATLDTTDVTKLAAWSSSDATVFTVSATGLVSPVSDGTAVVMASYDGLTATKSVTTSRCISWSISGPKVIWLGQSVEWQTDAYDSCINHIAFTSASFASMNTGVVTVNRANPVSSVTITGVTPGTAIIQASSPAGPSSGLSNANATGTVTVLNSVRPSPERITIAASPGSASVGLVLGVPKALAAHAYWTTPITWDEDVTTSVAWSTSDPGVAVVSSSGIATGVRPGSVTISATYQGVAATSTMLVGSDHDTLSIGSIDLHPDVDPFGRDRFNYRVEYTYTLASNGSGAIRIQLRDQATGAGVVSADAPVVKGAGASVIQGGIVTIPAAITTICGTLSLVPTIGTTLTVGLGCKPAHVAGAWNETMAQRMDRSASAARDDR